MVRGGRRCVVLQNLRGPVALDARDLELGQ